MAHTLYFVRCAVQYAKQWRHRHRFCTQCDAWHHVVVTRSGASISVYVDNDTPETGTIVGTPNTGAAAFRLGTLGTSTSFDTNAAIDEVAIVKGLAWDAAQGAYDFNAGAGRRYPD